MEHTDMIHYLNAISQRYYSQESLFLNRTGNPAFCNKMGIDMYFFLPKGTLPEHPLLNSYQKKQILRGSAGQNLLLFLNLFGEKCTKRIFRQTNTSFKTNCR
jgi:hypothetical protein